jgi:peptidoglycan/LPS O-acetylase OafA/YrhL
VSRSAPQIPLIRPYMPELDVVRGVAILLVLFYHGIAPPMGVAPRAAARILLRLSQNGWVGVNLFFVLSGFLITGILLDSRGEAGYFRRFYQRRALRILPVLYATLLFLLVGGWISWRFLALAALFLANTAPFLGVALQYPPLWSLAVEEHFYLIWPGLVRKFSPAILAVFLVFICVLTPAVRAFGFYLSGQRPDFAPLYTWFNLDGLAMGALLAIWLRQQSFRRLQLQRIAFPIMVLGVSAFILISDHLVLDKVLSITASNLASAGLLSCMLLLGTSRWSRVIERPVLRFLGYISYGLYLIHVLAFRAAERLLSRWSWIAAIHPLGATLLRFVIGAGLAILIAYLSRRALEEKFLQMGSRSRRSVTPAEAVATAG